MQKAKHSPLYGPFVSSKTKITVPVTKVVKSARQNSGVVRLCYWPNKDFGVDLSAQ
jgi:hypothetical protein